MRAIEEAAGLESIPAATALGWVWNRKPLTRGLVPKGGLEPPRVAPYAPQTYVSTNSTTSAQLQDRLSCNVARLSLARSTTCLASSRSALLTEGSSASESLVEPVSSRCPVAESPAAE